MVPVSGIYGVHNGISGKWYVGQSVDIRKRFMSHRSVLSGRTGNVNPHLKAAWDKYGEDAFEFIILEVVPDVSKLTEREEFWLVEKRENSRGVYNQRPVADSCLGVKHTEETREKLRLIKRGTRPSEKCMAAATAAKLGIPRPPELVEKLVVWGKKNMTPGHKAKMLAANLGSKSSEETRARQSAAWTPEMREARSIAYTGRKSSLETRAKQLAAWTPEKRAEMVAAITGKRHSIETREKMSVAKRKFSKEDVLVMRELCEDGDNYVQIGFKMGCSPCTARNAVLGLVAYKDFVGGGNI